MQIYRSLIEILRIEKKLSVEELVSNVCSVPMYYAFKRGEKNLSIEKLNKIKAKIGYVNLHQNKFEKYKKLVDELKDKIHFQLSDSKVKIQGLYDELFRRSNECFSSVELVIPYSLTMLEYEMFYRHHKIVENRFVILEILEDYMNLNQKIEYYHFLGTYYKMIDRFNDSQKYYSYSVELLQNSDIIFPKPYMFYALLLATGYKFNESYIYMEKAFDQLKQEMTIQDNINALLIKGVIYRLAKRFDESLNLLLKADELTKHLNYRGYNHLLYLNIAECYYHKKDYTSAIDNFRRGFFKYSGQDPLFNGYYRSLKNMLECLNIMGMREEYNKYFEHACDMVKNPIYKGADAPLLKLYILKIVDYSSFEEYIQKEAIKEMQSQGYMDFYSEFLETIVEYYKEKNKYKKAVEYLEILNKIYKRNLS